MAGAGVIVSSGNQKTIPESIIDSFVYLVLIQYIS
uniref:Uncharacterized protein n=2 Tax=unclassified Caudoviricetes TaxID=2788787 RepID=A0A8S5UZA2_9CAUD|nr:MAG TPA: hypothetical protein [Siphoviridae sp. ctZPw9]DAF99815.1 MAG TPA: hypothetical protein [Siphoviridae sp. ctPNJ4]